ncbi:ARL6IP4 (predicted) [Pycnogonum litorale]
MGKKKLKKRKHSNIDDESDSKTAKYAAHKSEFKKSKKKKSKKSKHKKEKSKKSHSKINDEDLNENHDGVVGPLPDMSQACSSNQPEPEERKMVPMTKEEWERQQSVVRRVYDPETGRNRLIKGDGEVIEEIVSYSRHKEINKQATKGDEETYKRKMGLSSL